MVSSKVSVGEAGGRRETKSGAGGKEPLLLASWEEHTSYVVGSGLQCVSESSSWSWDHRV